jgi:hypothetical protein
VVTGGADVTMSRSFFANPEDGKMHSPNLPI